MLSKNYLMSSWTKLYSKIGKFNRSRIFSFIDVIVKEWDDIVNSGIKIYGLYLLINIEIVKLFLF